MEKLRNIFRLASGLHSLVAGPVVAGMTRWMLATQASGVAPTVTLRTGSVAIGLLRTRQTPEKRVFTEATDLEVQSKWVQIRRMKTRTFHR